VKAAKLKAAFRVDPATRRRLEDQLAVFEKAEEVKRAGGVHASERLLREIAFYPAHSKRVETPEYPRVHRELIVEKDLPCMVRGVRQSTLGVPAENPYGAKQMETHHCIIEWALAEAIDVDKFNRTILPHLAERQPGNAEYRTAFDRKRLPARVDHSVDNLWVLCDVHHRARYFGIHEITFPVWGAQGVDGGGVCGVCEEEGGQPVNRSDPCESRRETLTAPRPRKRQASRDVA
jgi:hypothetical protein